MPVLQHRSGHGRIVDRAGERSVVYCQLPSGASRNSQSPGGEDYSEATAHWLEADRPKNRLSYIGTIWVAGQMKLPAAVARASTE